MILKAVQWNIGGAKLRNVNSPAYGPYNIDNIDCVVYTLRKYEPDVITLQETHSNSRVDQAEYIADCLNFPYVIADTCDKSHLEKGMELGQAILSRFPLSQHKFEFFMNPLFEVIRPDGQRWVTHNKGVTRCVLTLNGTVNIELLTLQLIPFHVFGVNLLDSGNEPFRSSVVDLIRPTCPQFLLQGDFNVDSMDLKRYFPEIWKYGASEVLLDSPTNAYGKCVDHIVFGRLSHERFEINTDVLTDHFPIYSEFKIADHFE